MVTVAYIHYSKAVLLLMHVLKGLVCNTKGIIAGGAYRGEIAAEIKKSFGYILEIVMRTDDKKTGFKPVHKRWVVECTFSWLNNDRRLCRNYELLLKTSEEMVKLSAIKLLLNKVKTALIKAVLNILIGVT